MKGCLTGAQETQSCQPRSSTTNIFKIVAPRLKLTRYCSNISVSSDEIYSSPVSVIIHVEKFMEPWANITHPSPFCPQAELNMSPREGWPQGKNKFPAGINSESEQLRS